jgi:hypothetical protein
MTETERVILRFQKNRRTDMINRNHISKFLLKRPRSLILAVVIVMLGLITAGCSQHEKVKAENEWISLFNGKDLEGWTPKFAGNDLGINFKNTFRVEDGLLKVSYDQYEEFTGEFGHLFYEKPFSHYILCLEYRFVGDQTPGGPSWAFRNSGVMLHCQSPESMALDQNFPVSIEAQFLGGNGLDDRPTANLCTPGTNVVMDGELVTRHCTSSSSATYHGDQWVTVEIEVNGSVVIKHSVNGENVLEYTQPQLDPTDKDAQKLIKDGYLILEGGYISLQAESHPLEFRKVEIKVLNKYM